MNKVFDANGNIVDRPDDVPVNDLTLAPIYTEELPSGSSFLLGAVPAADGTTPRVVLIDPKLIATMDELNACLAEMMPSLKGDKGDTGSSGARGEIGPQGAKGDAGTPGASGE